MRTGGGCDYVAIESSDYEGLDDVASKDTYFSLGADNDVVEILGYRYGLYYSVLSDVPKVLLGSGNDRLVIKSTDGVAIENAFVDGGDGDDEVAIEGLFANSVIDLGMGYDILAISGQMNDYQLDGRFLFMKDDPDRRLKLMNVEEIRFLDKTYALSPPVVRGNSLYRLVDGSSCTYASSQATGLGGSLVTINDASENQFLVDQFSDKSGEYEGLWIGLDDAIVEGDFRWSSGSQSPYRNFYYYEPNGGLSENYVHMWSSNPWGYPVGSWNDIGDIPDNGLPDPSGKVKAFKGIAEVPIVTSIVFSPDTREGQIVTTTMRLSAGSQGTGNLMAGATIYWDISGPGITPADFGSGALSGSSIVGLDGVVVLTHAIANDLTTEGVENLQVRIFSDATKAFQVGATGSVAIQDTSVDSTLPTVASIALQGSTVILQMSEPVTATSVPVSYFSIATVSSTNTVTARTISAT